MNAIPRINQEKEDRCENGKPLIIIRFRDEHVAQRYKARVAHVVKDAMQQAPHNYSSDLGDDMDLELHIWPKDVDASGSDTHGLFVTEPNDRGFGIPSYSQANKRRKLMLTPSGSPTQLLLDDSHAATVGMNKRKLTKILTTQFSLEEVYGDIVETDQRMPTPMPRYSPLQLSLDESRAEMELHDGQVPAMETDEGEASEGSRSEDNAVAERTVLDMSSSLQNGDSKSPITSESTSLVYLRHKLTLLIEALGNPNGPDATKEVIVINLDSEEELETISLSDSMESPIAAREVNKSLCAPSTSTATPTGRVQGSELGTPVYNVASPYLKLPADKQVSEDVLNDRNLPASSGKYEVISLLIEKLQNEVAKLQEK